MIRITLNLSRLPKIRPGSSSMVTVDFHADEEHEIPARDVDAEIVNALLHTSVMIVKALGAQMGKDPAEGRRLVHECIDVMWRGMDGAGKTPQGMFTTVAEIPEA
jgi:hypothetical protein